MALCRQFYSADKLLVPDQYRNKSQGSVCAYGWVRFVRTGKIGDELRAICARLVILLVARKKLPIDLFNNVPLYSLSYSKIGPKECARQTP